MPSPASEATRRPAAREPVKLTMSTSGWPTMASPTTRPEPHTTLSTPAGQADFVRRIGQHQRAQRRQLRRLQHDGAAGGERRGHLRHNLMEWVVPRRDAADHADRLLDDERVAEFFFERVIADELRVQRDDRDRELGLHLLGKPDRRPDLVGDGLRHLRHTCFHRARELLEPVRAFFSARLRPALEACARRLDSAIDILHRCRVGRGR